MRFHAPEAADEYDTYTGNVARKLREAPERLTEVDARYRIADSSCARLSSDSGSVNPPGTRLTRTGI
jgi:hypothetical protein